jgi:hypothetical protein
VGVQAEDAAGDRGTEAARPARQGRGAFLTPGPGPQDSERDHESNDQGDGQAGQDAFHGMQRATERADAITA